VTVFFVLIAALMLCVALALLLRPLLRGGSRAGDPAAAARRRMKVLQEALDTGVLNKKEFAAKKAELGSELLGALDVPPPRSRSAFFAAVAVALLLPASAIVLYRVVGEPRALDPASIPPPAAQAPAEHGGQDMDQAIAKLAEKLKQNPDDVGGWTLLGRAYLETEHFSEARDALKHAHDLAPAEPDVSVAYAEALTLSGASHRIDGEAKALIDAALKADPQNQRGLWLLGVSAYQDRDYNGAIASWNRLLALLPADSTVVQSVKSQIARAEAERDGRAPPEEQASAPGASAGESTTSTVAAQPAPASSPPGAEGPHLTVKVELDAKLVAKAAPGDTVFVYAKAASGPPMPLAVQRLRVEQLPATVTLTDGMGMLPNMKLSQFPQVIVGARISKSGNAIAQSGDLQTTSKPLAVTSTAPISLTIDQVVP
jgi:cytochrome c-type biogenesis protein CcmH